MSIISKAMSSNRYLESSVESTPPDESRINILLVDDEPKNLTVLETILDDPGYNLVRADSAEQGLLALVNQEFALIVLDINMPGMNGFELAHMIKQRKKTASIPIIFLTAYYSEDQHILEGYETGAVDYLHKPVNPIILRSKVAVFVDLYRKTREAAATNTALIAEIMHRERAQQEISQLNDNLELRVLQRTAELQQVNFNLSSTQKLLELAQQAGQVGIWDWDILQNKLTWTDAVWEIFDPHSPREEVTIEKWISLLHAEDRERVAEKLYKLDLTDVRYREEYRIVDGNQQIRWIEAVGILEQQHGKRLRMRGAVRDITERKLHELELKDADRRKDEFLAMLGHEIRNPLAPIRNAVFILRQIPQHDSNLTWCTDIIDRQSEHLTRLVDDLLDVSRVSRGKIQLHHRVFDINSAIERAIESSRPLIDTRRHTLELKLPTAPLLVHGDPTRISQVVANLLNNAAKYTDEGGQISLSAEQTSIFPSHVLIRVRDNGRGLDTDSLHNLFTLFYQGRRNLDRSEGGLGIGLALARILVEMHGGKIEATSSGLGQGSEFCVSLPYGRETTRPKEVPATSMKQSVLSDFRVLVAEDNLDVANTLALALRLIGCQVRLVHDGLSAVDVAVEEQPDAILLDIGLPGLDGYQACAKMRERGLVKPLILALTGYGQDSDRKLSKEAGFDEHFVKPADLEKLQELFVSHLEKR